MPFADLLQIRESYVSGIERFDGRAAAGIIFFLFALLLASCFVAALFDARKFLLPFLECGIRSTSQNTLLLRGPSQQFHERPNESERNVRKVTSEAPGPGLRGRLCRLRRGLRHRLRTRRARGVDAPH